MVKSRRAKLIKKHSKRLPRGLTRLEPGWESVKVIGDLSGHPPKFVTEDESSNRILIRFFKATADGSLRGKIWFGPLCEGPPGGAHGGSVAAVLDEAMGQAGWIAGYPVLAAKIEVNFRKMVPLKIVMTLEAKVVRVEGRKIFVEGRVVGPDGVTYSDSTGLFILFDPKLLPSKSPKRKSPVP